MSNYLASENISVYPSARRGVQYPESRLVTESALVSIVNKLIDREGFVITRNFIDSDSSSFEFNIYGYYFKVTPSNSITSKFTSAANGSTIYGVIKLAKIIDNVYELSGQDEDEEYTAVEFLLRDDLPVEDNPLYERKYLALLDKVNGQWQVHPDSLFKFDLDSSTITEIDGGEI